ncbi:hypothetical protein [Saccharospirillum alexandrii]|uniref:hypothetical protein n=1 Tax=Saccharospirillum alexandrii TaxID=2448477 RepID=UPI003735696D
MTVQTLLNDLDRLLMQPDRLAVTMPAWREDVEAALPAMTREEATTLLSEAQRVLDENRSLFETESLTLLSTLVEVHGGRKSAQKSVNQYRDINQLSSKPKGQPR